MKLQWLTFLFLMVVILQSPANAAEGIGWIPTWEQALAEARESSKPIMLVAGAPHCGGVSGVW